jgi:hypothetical protein
LLTHMIRDTSVLIQVGTFGCLLHLDIAIRDSIVTIRQKRHVGRLTFKLLLCGAFAYVAERDCMRRGMGSMDRQLMSALGKRDSPAEQLPLDPELLLPLYHGGLAGTRVHGTPRRERRQAGNQAGDLIVTKKVGVGHAALAPDNT